MTPRRKGWGDGLRLAGRRAVAGLMVAGLLSACAMPERLAGPRLYDFGPGSSVPAGAAPAVPAAMLPALAVSVQASPALDGTAMLYRLAYADAGQLHAYAHSRWAMAPADLVQQRLRQVLNPQHAVLKPGEGAPRVLQLELEEFSQVFETPGQSGGWLRLHATVLEVANGGQRVLAQRSVAVQRHATTADAAGGVRALDSATDAAAQELMHWLQQVH